MAAWPVMFAGMMKTREPIDHTKGDAAFRGPDRRRASHNGGGVSHPRDRFEKSREKDEIVVAAEDQAKLELERQVKDMLRKHVGTPAWTALLERAQAAATLGENSFELVRFPCDLCSDGGRKIDVAETDWPTTLRGEAAEFYTRWGTRPARGQVRASAQLVDYIDGIGE